MPYAARSRRTAMTDPRARIRTARTAISTATLWGSLLMTGTAFSATSTPQPPAAEKHPRHYALHGDQLTDDFAWLRDKQDPNVIAYLEAENAYTDALTKDDERLRKQLYDEMLARIQQTDLTVPYRKGGHLYYSRTEEGKQYPIFCRKAGDEKAPEQVMLDLNELATGHTFMAIGDMSVSPDEKVLADSTDDNGYGQYRLHVKDLDTGDTLAVIDERVTSLAWAADSRTLFYTQEDPVSKRSYRLLSHELGQPNPVLRDEERDERFDVNVELSRSGEWLLYTISSHTTSEVRVLRADQTTGTFAAIAPRVQDREYYVDHRRGEFWIRTNDKGRNFRLVTAPVATPDPAHWTEVLPHRDDVMLSNVECFAHHVVLSEREHALPQI